MASSSEAFKKFEQWRKSKTPLRVTVIEDGKTIAVLQARVDATDPDASLVGVAIDATRKFANFNVEGSDFSIEPSRMTVTRSKSDWMVFEELL